jgi:dCTP deaminase
MILKSDIIYDRLNISSVKDRLVIVPFNGKIFKKSDSSSIDLRLGTRFLSTKHSRCYLLDIIKSQEKNIFGNQQIMEDHYVPFGNPFILHPNDFVLGVTLEWIKLPHDLAGYVQGKSSWGRRGLVIATAVGVHTGFSGCLTLEITNLGEVPIAIYPGMPICQLFLHDVRTSREFNDRTNYYGKTKPVLGEIKLDDVAKRLAKMK